MKKWLIGGSIIIVVAALGFLIFQMMQTRIPAYILPFVDYRGPETAPAALEGRITALDNNMITIKPKDGSAAMAVALTEKTNLFSYHGGMVKQEELAVGQFVSVWFVTRDPQRAGKPPRAAVIMPFSLDPNDQPPIK
jgi:hypothetical protein